MHRVNRIRKHLWVKRICKTCWCNRNTRLFCRTFNACTATMLVVFVHFLGMQAQQNAESISHPLFLTYSFPPILSTCAADDKYDAIYYENKWIVIQNTDNFCLLKICCDGIISNLFFNPNTFECGMLMSFFWRRYEIIYLYIIFNELLNSCDSINGRMQISWLK